jgi:hypothetical protein
MGIETIDFHELPLGRHSTLAGAAEALDKLLPGQAVKMPCQWHHTKGGTGCNGRSWAHSRAKRHGWYLRIICRDGLFYMGRPPTE